MHVFLLLSFPGFWLSAYIGICLSEFMDLCFYRCTGLRVSCSGVFQEMDKIKDVYMKRVIYVKQIFQAAAFFSIV